MGHRKYTGGASGKKPRIRGQRCQQKRLIKAAKKKRSKREQSTTKREDASPTVAIATSWQQEHKIDEWVQSLDASKCNPEQKEFCKRIAGRVQTELRQDGSEEAAEMSEPLRWALHGGPGTGKSYTLNLVRKELFERILGWGARGPFPSGYLTGRHGGAIGRRYNPPCPCLELE